MFTPAHWAQAFINSLEAEGGDFDEGVSAFTAFSIWGKSLPGAVFGSSIAEKLENLARNAARKTGALSPAAEIALGFMVLMVKKNKFRYIDSVLEETRKILDKKNGVVKASLDYVLLPDDDFLARVKEALKRKTGAFRVELDGQVSPCLIGGYRLRLGDEVIDASVRFQLEKMEASLAAGISGPGDGGI